MKKQEIKHQKNGNRVMTAALILCAVLVIGVILTLALGDRVSAHVKLSGLRSDLADAADGDCVVSITQHGFFTDSIYQTATAVLAGKDAEDAVLSLRELTGALDFEKQVASNTVGLAERMISVRYGEETLILYLTKDHLYLSVGRGACAVFLPEEDEADAFEAFFEKTTEHLTKSKQK